jgi:alpha-beta hydrolase superfamily lysophospholipase
LASPDISKLRAEFKGPHDLLTTSDGETIFLRRWEPASKSKTTFLIFHGITAYSGPYGPILADELAKSGLTVYGMDLRGHGLSGGKRGDYPNAERLRMDLCETITFVKSKSTSLVALGHSLGALSAIISMNHCPKGIDGLVLVSAADRIRTGMYPRPKTIPLIKSLLGVSLLRGSPLIEYRRSGMIGLQDPLFNFSYSARFMAAFYGVGALTVAGMMRKGRLESPNLKFESKLDVPLFLAVGEKDELFSVEAARAFFNGIQADDKEFGVIPGAMHALFPTGCWTQLIKWTRKHFS